MFALAVIALVVVGASAHSVVPTQGYANCTVVPQYPTPAPSAPQVCVVEGIAYPLGYAFEVPCAYNCKNYPTGTMKLWCTSPTSYQWCCGSACDAPKVACPPAYPVQPAVTTCANWGAIYGNINNACGYFGKVCANPNQVCGGAYGDCNAVCCAKPQPVYPQQPTYPVPAYPKPQQPNYPVPQQPTYPVPAYPKPQQPTYPAPQQPTYPVKPQPTYLKPEPEYPETKSTTCKIWAAKTFGKTEGVCGDNSNLKPLAVCGGAADMPCALDKCCAGIVVVPY